jgi:hypothetical protein
MCSIASSLGFIKPLCYFVQNTSSSCFNSNLAWAELPASHTSTAGISGPVHCVLCCGALLLLLAVSAADCLAMPHLTHMAFGLVIMLLFCFATLCMVSRLHVLVVILDAFVPI